MKKYMHIFFFLFFLLFTCDAFAGSTTLTTYYPPPTAAYNKVNLATNATASPAIMSSPTNCAANSSVIFINTDASGKDASGQALVVGSLYQCTTAAGAATLYCTNAPPGALIADTTGTLHVCMNGLDTIYPQECYNSFCSYDNSSYNAYDLANPCNAYLNVTLGVQGVCQKGFLQTQSQVLPGLANPQYPKTPAAPSDTKVLPSYSNNYDWFNTTAHTTVISIVCCSGTPGIGTSGPPAGNGPPCNPLITNCTCTSSCPVISSSPGGNNPPVSTNP